MRFLQGHAALLLLLTTAAMTFPTACAFAQDAYWQGGNDWWNMPWWSTGIEPDASTTAIIEDGHVTVDSVAVAAEVRVTDTGILEFQNQTANNLLINLFEPPRFLNSVSRRRDRPATPL